MKTRCSWPGQAGGALEAARFPPHLIIKHFKLNETFSVSTKLKIKYAIEEINALRIADNPAVDALPAPCRGLHAGRSGASGASSAASTATGRSGASRLAG